MASFPSIVPNDLQHKIIKKKISAESSAGYFMSRPAGSVAKKEFTLSFASLTITERNTLQTFFDTNQGLAITWTHPETGGATYNVSFLEDELSFNYVPVDRYSVSVKLREL